ncbi:hypothetical protein Clacol_008692 [Clathrus columnatus]|uniref:Uncharacterized protein n=1 Tax=Clathrus columnatus TaxID=1419009 RepID=A0AAV5AP23_9AGAM|nr:hypothetical protein Clacol_008692 [Clathrus columnatus]
MSVGRFASADAWIQGQLRDLLDAIPSKLHEHISNKHFINTFVHAMHQQRSNASTRVRPHCGAAIFRCTNEKYADRGNIFKELIGWTVPDHGEGSGYYEPFAPILFKDYDGLNDKWKIFRNPILMRTYAALLLGPSSVKNTKGDQIFIRDSSHCNMESLWKVRRLTPGAIAMTAILVRLIMY